MISKPPAGSGATKAPFVVQSNCVVNDALTPPFKLC